MKTTKKIPTGSKYPFRTHSKPCTTLSSLPGITSTAPANTDRTFLSGRSHGKKNNKSSKIYTQQAEVNKRQAWCGNENSDSSHTHR